MPAAPAAVMATVPAVAIVAVMATVTAVAMMAIMAIMAMVVAIAATVRPVPQAEGNRRADVIRHAGINRCPIRVWLSSIAGVAWFIDGASTQRRCDNERKNQAFCNVFRMRVHGC